MSGWISLNFSINVANNSSSVATGIISLCPLVWLICPFLSKIRITHSSGVLSYQAIEVTGLGAD
jgi:hypothetical protein